MTTKTATPRQVKPEAQLPDGLKTAYEVHTLAQLLYGRVTAIPPWVPTAQNPYSPVLH
jgi:hypothetical protein